MGGGGDEESGDTTIHYAPFLETAVGEMIDHSGADTLDKSVFQAMNEAFGQSPFGDAGILDPDRAYFGEDYTRTSFPTMFDMYGKFIGGLDVHSLWEQTYNGLLDSPAVSAMLEAEGQRLTDDLEQVQLPRFEAGMRDIGAVNSSAFVLGRALLEDARIKALNEFSAKVQIAQFNQSAAMWQTHLDWNKNVYLTYHDLQQGYDNALQNANEQNLGFAARNKLWDLSLYEYGRAVAGVLNGAAATAENPNTKELSTTSKVLSGAAAGAAAGSYAGLGWGTVIGGVLGGLAGLFS